MPLKKYGVLKGKAIEARRETEPRSPHYQVHIEAGDVRYRIAVNVKSQLSPSELLFLVDDDFQHSTTASLPGLSAGFTALRSQTGGPALDFIRGNLFDRLDMRLLPPHLPGPNNDLSDQIEHYVKRAMEEPDALIYAFGERWGPEENVRDKVFGFTPGNGIHDIHMNQGNVPRFAGDDGVWQDGALLFEFPASRQWVGVFLAFQSQAWHTDDRTGHTSPDVPNPGPGPQPSPTEPDHLVQIVGALVNPVGPAPEQETVTLINTSPTSIDLTGWKIADRLKKTHTLSGVMDPGVTLVVTLPQEVQLGNKGGIITLLNDKGLKVDGVSYTAQQAKKEGWTIVF
ncbi:MAG: DUF2278 family protein [Nitrospira sp.]|nr:DUF2278 family protein [Nitrospira sp.]